VYPLTFPVGYYEVLAVYRSRLSHTTSLTKRDTRLNGDRGRLNRYEPSMQSSRRAARSQRSLALSMSPVRVREAAGTNPIGSPARRSAPSDARWPGLALRIGTASSRRSLGPAPTMPVAAFVRLRPPAWLPGVAHRCVRTCILCLSTGRRQARRRHDTPGPCRMQPIVLVGRAARAASQMPS
jgi:hypothetical protein